MQKFEAYEDSVEAKTKSLTASFEKLSTDTINGGVVKGFLDLANVFVNILDKVGLFNAAILTTAGILGSKGILMIPQLATFIGGLIQPMLGASAASATLAGTLGAALSVIAPVAIILGAVAAYDKLNVTLEESQEKLVKQKDLYDSESANIQSLTDELESTKKKLEDLNSMGGAKVSKDGELEKLQDQTEELQRQLDIAKETQRVAGLEAEQTATKTLGTKIDSKYDTQEIHSELTGYSVKHKQVTRDVELEKTISDYNTLSKLYDNLEKKQQDLANSGKGNTKEFKNNSKELKNLSDQMDTSRKYANDLATNLQTESESLIGATDKGKEMKNVVDKSLDSYHDWINAINNTNNSLEESTDETEDATQSVEDLTKAYDDAVKKRKELYSGTNFVGNVDVNNRPVVVNKDGSYSTTETSFQEKWVGDEKNGGYKIIHFTPILPDGTVLEGDALNTYVDKILSSSDSLKADNPANGGYGIVYKVDTEVNGKKITDENLKDAFGIADAWDVEMHNLQDKMYGAEGELKSKLNANISLGSTFNFEDNKDVINDYKTSLASLSGALEKLKEDKLSSSDTLGLMQAFPDLEGHTDDLSSAITNLINKNLNELIKKLRDAGASDELIKLFKDMTDSAVYFDFETNQAGKAVKSLSDAMSSLSDVSGIIQSVKTDMKEMGSISEETLSTIASKYPQLESLVAEYNAGIASSGDIISALSKIYDQDAENFRKANNVKLEQSESFYTDVYNKIPDYIKNLADSYGIDLKNYKSVALAKADINNKLVSALSKAWEDAGGDNLGDVAQQRLEQQIMRQPEIVDLFALSDSINSVTADLQTGINITPPKSSKGNGKTKKDKKTFDQDIDWIATSVDIAEKAVEKFKDTMSDDAPYQKQIDSLNKLIALQRSLVNTYKEGAKAYKEEYTDSIKGLDKKYVTQIQNGGTFNVQDFKGDSGEKVYNQITEAQKYWKEYQDMLGKVDSTNKAIIDSSKKAMNLQIESLFSVIDKTIENYNNAYSSINDLASQYKEGSTQQIEAYTQGINKASSEIKYLNDQIAKLNEMQKNGAFKGNMQAYKDEIAKLEGELYNARDAINDFQESMAKAIDAQKDKIFDDRKKAYDKQTDSIQKQSDALKDILNSQKELLELTEKQHDYEVGIANRLKDINKIESRMAELKKAADSGDRKAQAELDQAAEDLAEKKTDLTEEQHDHEVDLQKDSLDKALSDNDKITKAKLDSAKTEYDDKTEKLTALYEKENQLIINAANLTKEQFSAALKDINDQFASLGVTVSPETTKAILGAQAGISDNVSGNPSSSDNSNSVAIKSLLASGTSTKGDSELNKYIKANYGSYLTYAEMAQLGRLLKVSGISVASDMESGQNRNKVLTALKNAGFKTGGTVDASRVKNNPNNFVRSLGEDAMIAVGDKEGVLTPTQNQAWQKLSNYVPQLVNMFSGYHSAINPSNYTTNNNSSPTLQINLPPNSTITRDAVEPLKQYSQDILNSFAKDFMFKQRQY